MKDEAEFQEVRIILLLGKYYDLKKLYYLH